MSTYLSVQVWTPPPRFFKQPRFYILTNPPAPLPINEIWDKQKNKPLKESCFFMFRRLQNNITSFL